MTSPAQLWPEILRELRRGMTQATFDAHLRDTRVHAANGTRWTIAVPNPTSRDWLNARLKPMVEQAITNIIDFSGPRYEAVFILPSNSESPKPNAPPSQPEPLPPSPSTNENPVLSEAEGNVARTVAETDLLSVYFGKGTLGYDSIPHEVELFKMPVLGPAYLLWRNLVAEDTRPLADIAPNFWTPVMRYSLTELAARLNRKHPRYVGGDALECDYSRQARRRGDPLRGPEDCCGSERYTLLWFKRQKENCMKCLHWSVGLLEILQQAKLIRIERQASGYKPAMQVWRLPTLLTPAQYATLTDSLQADYRSYIERHGPRFGLAGFEEWLTIEQAYLEPLLPGYKLAEVDNNWQREIYVKFLQNAVVNPKISGSPSKL